MGRVLTFGGAALGTGHGTFGTFTPFTNLSTDPVVHIALGDFNQDGFPDIAVVQRFQGSGFNDGVSVLLGSASGAFGLGGSKGLETQVTSMAVGNMNVDKYPDLVLSYGGPAERGGGAVAVLLRKGDGTFPTSPDNRDGDIFYHMANIGYSVTIADLNGDDMNDIAVSATNFPGDNDLAVLPGIGDGTLGTPLEFTGLSGNLSRIAIADINRDGRKDVLITNDMGIPRLINLGVLGVSPTSLNFRGVPVGSSSSKTITVTNPVSISRIIRFEFGLGDSAPYAVNNATCAGFAPPRQLHRHGGL